MPTPNIPSIKCCPFCGHEKLSAYSDVWVEDGTYDEAIQE